MANPNRRKGTTAENKAVQVFAPWFRYCERRALRGKNDGGDLAGLPIPVEVKCSSVYLVEAMGEAKRCAQRLKTHGYAAYVPIRGRTPEEGITAFPAWFGAELLACWDSHQPKELG